MVLLKIDALSLSELQYIASQEEIDDWEELNREELIEAIKDIYEDVDTTSEINNRKSLHKFSSSLTDKQFTRMVNLPGVEALPDQYLETSIHMLLKDSSWAYVFWSVSPNTKNNCFEKDEDCQIIMRCRLVNDESAFFDKEIDISEDSNDISYSITLPYLDTDYQALLLAIYPSTNTTEILAKSEVVHTPKAIDKKVVESIRNTHQANLILSSSASVNGEIMNNKLVHELFDLLNQGALDE